MENSPKILVIEDEPIMRVTINDALKKEEYNVVSTESGSEGLEMIQNNLYDIVITDLRLPQVDGMEILKATKKVSPDTYVILITAYATVDSAVEAMKQGAYDYLTKPFALDILIIMVKRLLKWKQIEWENIKLRQEIEKRYVFEEIIGKSPKMLEIFELINTLAKTDTTVLIQGETGTGKELVANAIHQKSPRKDKPFVKVSCAAIPDTLLESELFGHEKGAFTNAFREKKGKFELAHEGTILLDEVGDLPLHLQGKLLRVLQHREYERVGSIKPIKIDVRVLSATKKDLKEEVEKDNFRDDLFYRLSVVPIILPPLRERKEDISLIADHFLKRYSAKMGKSIKGFSPDCMRLMLDYYYPGNVRELENAIERSVILCTREEILPKHLPLEILRGSSFSVHLATPFALEDPARPLCAAMQDFEKDYILQVLKSVQGKKGEAARILGISRKSLWEKLKAYKLDNVTFSGSS